MNKVQRQIRSYEHKDFSKSIMPSSEPITLDFANGKLQFPSDSEKRKIKLSPWRQKNMSAERILIGRIKRCRVMLVMTISRLAHRHLMRTVEKVLPEKYFFSWLTFYRDINKRRALKEQATREKEYAYYAKKNEVAR